MSTVATPGQIALAEAIKAAFAETDSLVGQIVLNYNGGFSSWTVTEHGRVKKALVDKPAISAQS